MDNQILQDKTPLQRREILTATADGIEEMTIVRKLTDDQLAILEKEFAKMSLIVDRINTKKADYVAEIKSELKPLKCEISIMLQQLKTRTKESVETVYKLKDFDEKMIGLYDVAGKLIESRRMQSTDMQTSILDMSKTGTD